MIQLMIIIVLFCLVLSTLAFLPTIYDGVRIQSMEILAKHGKKKWIELGYNQVDNRSDQDKWEQSKKRWEVISGATAKVAVSFNAEQSIVADVASQVSAVDTVNQADFSNSE